MIALFAVTVAIAVIAARPFLSLREAISFGLIAMGLLFFGRLLVCMVFGYLVSQLAGQRAALLTCSILTEAALLFVAGAIDVNLLWSAAAAVVFSELFFLSTWRQAGGS